MKAYGGVTVDIMMGCYFITVTKVAVVVAKACLHSETLLLSRDTCLSD